MSFTTSNGNDMVMPVAPMGNYGGSNGFGWGGDGAWWLLVLFLFAANGNGFGWGGNGGGMPYMMQQNTNADLQRGFDQQALMGGIGDLALAVRDGFSTAEASNNARQIANMQQQFALQSQFSQCCCDNRLGIANLQSTVLSENCADRAAVSDGVRDILANQTANTQALINSTNQAVQGVMNKICQLELDAKNTKISELQQQLTMANLAASQTAQTARILADNAAQTTALEQYLNPTPIPAYVVQNPSCCNQGYYMNTGCGCNG